MDFRGGENKPIWDALKDYGFRFAKRGHDLASGKVGTRGHSCLKPTPIKREKWQTQKARGGDRDGDGARGAASAPVQRPDFINQDDGDLEARLLKAIS